MLVKVHGHYNSEREAYIRPRKDGTISYRTYREACNRVKLISGDFLVQADRKNSEIFVIKERAYKEDMLWGIL